mmetsp:Transcript_15384/g.42393  ORF Transcript_15384/g.42393 Transcript_15384/m.42393 type:complete len:164 (-) Transcript_15384:32-523(-)|eukprot:CAMPEP_0179060788 /NCGR_PEP_ID=MMETSP0796-20121207/26045_1 /TAXON_ID=73915 /ORGANISM="Pyrodinium bahamense, Strain pbaha01" /LENGTH=163 /DNA_ID=CAMNT_0020757579 /DNA_START=31 /DNA_END=522 /DNA_ORIENTATION=+
MADASPWAQQLLCTLKAWFWESDGFANEVFGFAEQHKEFFEAAGKYFDAGGEEHPLDWTALHAQFRLQFEGRLQDFLTSQGTTMEGLQEALAAGVDENDRETNVLVDVMLSLTDYELWLKSMLALSREDGVDRSASCEAPLPGQELEPTAPLEPPIDGLEAFM